MARSQVGASGAVRSSARTWRLLDRVVSTVDTVTIVDAAEAVVVVVVAAVVVVEADLSTRPLVASYSLDADSSATILATILLTIV